jgi:hypothetical protein
MDNTPGESGRRARPRITTSRKNRWLTTSVPRSSGASTVGAREERIGRIRDLPGEAVNRHPPQPGKSIMNKPINHFEEKPRFWSVEAHFRATK